MQDSGQPEDARAAKPEGAETEATRGTTSRRQGNREFGVTRRLKPKAKPEGERGGATRYLTERRNWKSDAEGQPEAAAPEASKDAIRGNSKNRRRQSRKMQDPGQPGKCISRHNRKGKAAEATPGLSAGCAEGCEIRGNSKIHRRQGRKMHKPGRPGGRIERRDQRKTGATWASTEEAPKDARRGNSKLGRRQSLRMQDAGQLAASSRGATGRAGPRGLSARRTEGCGNRGNSKLHRGHSL